MGNSDISINRIPLRSIGVTMLAGAYSALLTPAPLKDYVKNDDPTKPGTDVLVDNPVVSERDVTLTFLIEGTNRESFLSNYNAFVSELHKGEVVLYVPDLNLFFHLLYSNSTQFENYRLNACKLAVKFNEPNPSNRRSPLNEMYYGIEFDTADPSPSCSRIGRPAFHVSLPIQSRMRRCILRDNGTVAYYLHANDSTKRDTGAAAKLDGTDGQYMVEIPAHYRKFETEGTKFRCLISEHALPGYHYVPLAYRSAVETTVDRTVAATPKLASVVSTSTAFRGGNNNAAWDGTYHSLLGMPATAISLTNFRAYARNRGSAGKNAAGWNCDVYEVQKTCWWLYAVEYANLNCQLAYNAQPTIEGYKQGGLGAGVTTINYTKWLAYNGAYPFIPCGYTNSLGNKTGIVYFSMPDEYAPGVVTKVEVPSYRGLENPFGHLWSWTDGCKCNIQSEEAGGLSEFFVCADPAKFQSDNYEGYEKRGELPRKEGYVKAMMIGEYGENMPIEVGAGSTTYFCDYFYTSIPASGESQRGVLFGGLAHDGAAAGFSYANTINAATIAGAAIGSRLCFLPE